MFVGEYCHNALEAGVANVDVAGGQGTTLQVTLHILVLRDDTNFNQRVLFDDWLCWGNCAVRGYIFTQSNIIHLNLRVSHK